jgi:hypothetical protein
MIKSAKENLLAQLAKWDPEFGMAEKENLEFMATSNPAGEAAEKTLLASVESMSVMQKVQTDTDLEESSQSQQQRSGASQSTVQRSQQHDTRGVHPIQDDTSVVSFQDSIAMQKVQYNMESVKS